MANEVHHPGPSLLPEQRAALERLLSSGRITRAPRLREFLVYVSECMLAGRQDEVTEEQIGCRVFGRPEGYNHAEDNIVRVTARNLRIRLEEYYQAEGASESWIFEIPKGGYLPAFRRREQVEPLLAPSPSPQSAPPRSSSREILAWCLCVSLSVALLVSLWFRPLHPNNVPAGLIPALFPNPAERVTVVMVDSALQLYRSLAERTVPLDAYLTGRYLQPGYWPSEVPLSAELQRFFRNGKDTTFSSTVIAGHLFQNMPSGQVEIRHPTQLNSRDFQRNNFILLGGPWSNPWGQLFEAKLNFQILTGPQAKDSMIINRSPHPHEPETYSTSREGSLETSYVRIALLPNLGGTGKVLLLGATTSGAMEAASDFLLRPDRLESVRQLLSVKPSAPIPYFELVLEVKAVDVTPHGMRVVAVRNLGAPVR